jgi:hypothetical protein
MKDFNYTQYRKDNPLLKEDFDVDQNLSDERNDLFWDTASDSGLEPAVAALKQAGFSLEEVCGFIESHWDRY